MIISTVMMGHIIWHSILSFIHS